MKKLFPVIFLLLSACYETEYSAVLNEPATVVDVIFSPSNHGDGVGIGFDMSGKGGMSVVPVDVDIPAKYAIVFQCKHGKFVIDRNQEQAKEMWGRLKRDQRVMITYREKYHSTYKDGKMVSKELVKYDFIHAE